MEGKDKKDINIKEEIEEEFEKEKIIIKEKEKISEEKMEISAKITLIERSEENEDGSQNYEKEKIEILEKPKEKEDNENSEKEKIKEEELEKLKEEKIKSIKLIPKEDLIIVVIHNITPNVNEGHLKEIFSNYGEVKEVYIPINNETSLKKNYAFIEFTKKENAEKAKLYMDEGQIDGKVVRVEILSPKNYIEMKKS